MDPPDERLSLAITAAALVLNGLHSSDLTANPVLVVIQPDTVVRWHREGLRRYWTWTSRRRRVGRPCTQAEIRAVVRRMAAENPTWGAPRVHGEMLMLGFDSSERTVSRSMPRRPTDSDAQQRWRSFLRNHREVLAAIDFLCNSVSENQLYRLASQAPHQLVDVTLPGPDLPDKMRRFRPAACDMGDADRLFVNV
jgi:hypothetical protein